MTHVKHTRYNYKSKIWKSSIIMYKVDSTGFYEIEFLKIDSDTNVVSVILVMRLIFFSQIGYSDDR